MLKVKNTFVKLEGIYVVKTHDRKRKIILRNNSQIVSNLMRNVNPCFKETPRNIYKTNTKRLTQ